MAIAVWAYATQGVVPLFPMYDDELGLSTIFASIVFASYGFVLIVALLAVEWSSDVIGRKRVILPCQLLYTTASLAFALAHAPAWLLAGRIMQGAAAGAFWGTATAFIRDLTPEDRRDDASLIVSMTMVGGAAVGVLVIGLLASATGSSAVPWVLHVVLMLGATILVRTSRETVAEPTHPHVRARPGLPGSVPRSGASSRR